MSVSLYKKSILLDIALIECTRHVGRFNSENGVVFFNCDILLHPIALIFLGSVIIPQHPFFFAHQLDPITQQKDVKSTCDIKVPFVINVPVCMCPS